MLSACSLNPVDLSEAFQSVIFGREVLHGLFKFLNLTPTGALTSVESFLKLRLAPHLPTATLNSERTDGVEPKGRVASAAHSTLRLA